MMLMTQGPLGPLVHFCFTAWCQSQNAAEFTVILTKPSNNTVSKGTVYEIRDSQGSKSTDCMRFGTFVDILKERAVTIFRVGKTRKVRISGYKSIRYFGIFYRTTGRFIPEDRNSSMRFTLGKKQVVFGDRCEETTSCYKTSALGIVCLHAMKSIENKTTMQFETARTVQMTGYKPY